MAEDSEADNVNQERFDNFILNEIKSVNEASNGLIHINSLLIGAYLVLGWTFVEKMNSYLTGPAFKHATTFFTGPFAFYTLFFSFAMMPIFIWLGSILFIRPTKKSYEMVGFSSNDIQSILHNKRNGYNLAQAISFFGLSWAIFVMAFLAGVVSGGF